MGEETAIGWTHHTFNPWRGCEHATTPDGAAHPGCTNCYAEAMSKRNPKALGTWGSRGQRVMAAADYWKLPARWNAAAEKAGERRRVFCASLADVFEDWTLPILDAKGGTLVREPKSGAIFSLDVKIGRHLLTMDDLRAKLFALIDATPWLDWLLLTKRPQNICRMWPAKFCPLDSNGDGDCHQCCRNRLAHSRRENVWLLTSVSDQATAAALIPELLRCRDLAPVLGISAEPLLGPIELYSDGIACKPCRFCIDAPLDLETNCVECRQCDSTGIGEELALDWVIVGGESGPGHRAMPLEPALSLVSQCEQGGVPCYVKQDSGARPGMQGRWPDPFWAVKEFPQTEVAV